jgi:hypothetical protein
VNTTDDPALQQQELRILRKGLAMVLTCGEIIRALRYVSSFLE